MTYAKRLVDLDFSWHPRAGCNDANRPANMPREWFGTPLDYRPAPRIAGGPPGRAVDEPSVRAAIAVCRRCPVIRQCAAQAGADRVGIGGVWAGRYVRAGGDGD